MNAIELYHQDGRTAGVFYCSQCHLLAKTKALADQCCVPYQCSGCGIDLPRKEYRTICPKCEEQKLREREVERFAKAEKVTQWDGWLYSEHVSGYNDGYFRDLGELEEYIADQAPHDDELEHLTAEERAEIPVMPEYLWTCSEERFAHINLDSILQQIEEAGYEDFDRLDLTGIEELSQAIDAFNTANAHIVSYSPDYKKALVLNSATPN